jgi:acylphosphatase
MKMSWMKRVMAMIQTPAPVIDPGMPMTDAGVSTNQFRLHALVEGHVQGVGFRYFVLSRAQQRNLTGWVRNTLDGNVEVIAEGDRADLDELLDALRTGPRSAFVSLVREKWEPSRGEFRIFDVRSTH